MQMYKKRAPRRSANNQSKYTTSLLGNSRLKTLTSKFSRKDIEQAAKYLAETYSILWEMANQNRKIFLIREVLEQKEKRGYGPWEIEKVMKERLGV